MGRALSIYANQPATFRRHANFSVSNVKVLLGTFNQEKALVGAFSVIVQLHRLIVYSTIADIE